MELSHGVQQYVDPSVRRRGAAYFDSGHVRIVAGTQRRVVALVRGSADKPYRVELKAKDDAPGDLLSRCDCAYFEGRGICKHIWATVLAAERRALLGDLETDQGVRLLDADVWGEQRSLDSDRSGDEADHLGDEMEESRDDFDGDSLSPEWEEDAGIDELPGDVGLDTRPAESPTPSPSQHTRYSSHTAPWQRELERVRQQAAAMQEGAVGSRTAVATAASELLYVLDPEACEAASAFVLKTFTRRRKRDESWTKPRIFRLDGDKLNSCRDPDDQRILSLLMGAATGPYGSYYAGFFGDAVAVRTEAQDALVPLLCATERFFFAANGETDSLAPLAMDQGEPWALELSVRLDSAREHWVLEGVLRCGDQTVSLGQPSLLLESGWVVLDGQIARLANPGCFSWISTLRDVERIEVPRSSETELLERFYEISPRPLVHWPDELGLKQVREPVRPALQISHPPGPRWASAGRLDLTVSFIYGGHAVSARFGDTDAVFDLEGRRLIARDPQAEDAALRLLIELGCRPQGNHGSGGEAVRNDQFIVAPQKVATLVHRLVGLGWRVEADGRLYRSGGTPQLHVRSGIDWFDLEGEVQFGTESVTLPAVLSALRRGENHVVLDDGSIGLLPEQWVQRLGLLQAAGEVTGDSVRFKDSQVLLLDALLDGQREHVESSWDKRFERARTKLRSFDQVRPQSPARSFHGTLRPYQKEGLGWVDFLRRFSLGGCLADDMGLGKTVQALAVLDRRRAQAQQKKKHAPVSLVVAPKSVVDNWLAEVKRFAPRLSVLVHSGANRATVPEAIACHDLVLTTYGILRKDAALLGRICFDYAILDEAQAIKNAQSQVAKASRLLKADNRLALSGTPVENHLGELWSLFEFLNPGMLGTHGLMADLAKQRSVPSDVETLQVIGRALGPLILRRTKDQVAPELPPKTEQTLFCELDASQRRLYREVREHYRSNLLANLDEAEFKRSKIQVLEALLRLRQIACHPALVDPKLDASASSSKIELLMEKLDEVLSEGHKALVFSQFTSLLAIVRSCLDKKGVTYEYLDGATRKRAEKVARFQQDESCEVFLISLKAGGLGLNLTAADYVFLLDPWWNPAVEAQAVDRAHRIGQDRHVFAYRLIAKDTVEEKVLELQASKRELADAIMGGSANLLRTLTRDDLQALLS